MRGSDFAELTAFAAIVERGSFIKAAAVLGISPSTLSQTIRTLEERLGVRLLNRTTRSLSLTAAGERLLARVGPALTELSQAAEAVNEFRDKPAGSLRLAVSSPVTAHLVIEPVLAEFMAEYPDIVPDLVIGAQDIEHGRFDAGIASGQLVSRDMVTLPVGPRYRTIAVAAPAYLASRPRPMVPQDLKEHRCIGFRFRDKALFHWWFEKDGEEIEIAVPAALVVNTADVLVRAALLGVGIGYMVEPYVALHIADGRLMPLLEDWAPCRRQYYLYYTSRRQPPAPLKAFIDFLRHHAAAAR